MVGDVEEALGRIEGEEARRAAVRRHPLPRCQRALDGIYRKHADAIVAAVGDIDVAAGAIDLDLRPGAVAVELRRRRRNRLQRHERARAAVLAISRQRRIEFVDDVGQCFTRMEIDVPRRGAGTGRDARGLDQHAALEVEPIGDDDIGALARHIEEAALPVERDVMHAHGALLEAVRSQGSGDGGERTVAFEAAVLGNGQHGERIRAVVGDGQETARRIEGEMHGIVAAGRLPVERRDMAGVGIDREGIGFGAIAVDRIEPRARRIKREERRVLQPTQALDVAEGAGAAVDLVDVDAVALAVALGRGVAADIGEERAGRADGPFHSPSLT